MHWIQHTRSGVSVQESERSKRRFSFLKKSEDNPSFGVELYTNPLLQKGYVRNYGESYTT